MSIAYIGLGANLPSDAGPPEATLVAAALRLGSLGRIVGCSSLYSTRPVGLDDQPRFLNAVVALETGLAPRPLLDGLLAVEREFGRDRSTGSRNGPRTLDLDILLFDLRTISEAGLEIPHPRLAERAFVLVPLAEIAPQAIHPVTNRTVAQLMQSLREKADQSIDAAVSLTSGMWRGGACRVAGGEPNSG